MGNAHTNTIENFWSLLKGGISGVYHAVSGKGIFEALGVLAWPITLHARLSENVSVLPP